LYGVVIAALVVLLGVSVFLLLASKSKTGNQPQSYSNAYRCSNCGNNLKQTDRFCGQCGAQIGERSA
jgi:predicted amidophosphoribosyltransferase